MDNQIKEKAQLWLNSATIDEETKSSITALMNDADELTESFYKDLEFGTGGLRGIMGVGSNRMNKYTIGMATQGLANYLKKSFEGEDIKVAIAHDSRNNSRFFAETAANVFSANGIKVYLFESLRPTPELSYAIRKLGCHGGVVLTASHNPKEYNGYKAYWNDGGQLVAPHDKNVITEVNGIALDDINFEANDALIESIGEDIDKSYLAEIKKLSLSPDAIAAHAGTKIVYSSIHGTGITLVPRCLEELGFKNITVVDEQKEPNGNFPTVVYPNPEEAEALKIALAKAQEIDADLVMATDPDADRIGIAVRNDKGGLQLLNGNQTGSLLIYYVLKRYTESQSVKGNEYIAKTIVTSELMDKIAEHFAVKCYNVLTGFKHIAALIKKLEGQEKFLVGGEESYGYLVGDAVRDKDAVASAVMIAEMNAYAQSQGQSLFDMLLDIYLKIGFYKEKLISVTKKGKSGAEEIVQMMANFRNNPPKKLGGSSVAQKLDYQESKGYDINTGDTFDIDLPKSNVLQFITEAGYKISARPSGTEPKIKFYISVNAPLNSTADYEAVNTELDKIIAQVEADLN